MTNIRSAVLMALALVATGCVASDPYARLARDLARPLRTQTRSVAVLPFRGLDRDLDRDGAAMAERLITRLHGRKGIALVERTRLDGAVSESLLGVTGAINSETAQKIGRLAGADAVVVGSVLPGREFLDLEARVVETESGRILATGRASLPRQGSKGDPPPSPYRAAPSSARRGPPQHAEGADLGSGRRLPWPVGGHAGAAVGGRLYVIGGVTKDLLGTGRGSNLVISAAILTDGALGRWRSEPALPRGTYQLAAAGAGGAVFALGGYDGAPISAVFSARVGSSGLVDGWRQEPPLPAPCTAPAAAVDDSRIFIVGCGDLGGPTKSIYSAAFDPESGLGQWRVQPFPYPVTSAGLAVSGRRLFVAGGSSTGRALKDVFSAPISDDGSLGVFSKSGELPEGLWTPGFAAASGRLWLAGGQGPAGFSDRVWSTVPEPGGVLGPWRAEPKVLREGRGIKSLPEWRGRLYFVGEENIQDRPGEVVVIPAGP